MIELIGKFVNWRLKNIKMLEKSETSSIFKLMIGILDVFMVCLILLVYINLGWTELKEAKK